MKTSPKAKALIQQFEGLKLQAYRCPAGKWTIGYGHTGPEVSRGMTITYARAVALLEADIAPVEDRLNAWLTAASLTLTQGQFDALVSFAFNLGLAALRGSTLWRKIQVNPADPTIPAEFARWVYATVDGKKVKLTGLVNRRKTEAQLWQS